MLAREYQADSAWLTKDGSDFGADGILATSNQSMLIQAKHKHGAYKGHSAVQEISNAKVLYGKHLGREISKLIFVTNATQLAKSDRDIAHQLDATVIDGNELKDLSERHSITFGQLLTRLSKERYVLLN